MEFLGTKLEPLATNSKTIADRKRKGIPAHLQEVRDEQGRQRLHGAFQGGFSAGYFNTVGSKEGRQFAFNLLNYYQDGSRSVLKQAELAQRILSSK